MTTVQALEKPKLESQLHCGTTTGQGTSALTFQGIYRCGYNVEALAELSAVHGAWQGLRKYQLTPTYGRSPCLFMTLCPPHHTPPFISKVSPSPPLMPVRHLLFLLLQCFPHTFPLERRIELLHQGHFQVLQGQRGWNSTCLGRRVVRDLLGQGDIEAVSTNRQFTN